MSDFQTPLKIIKKIGNTLTVSMTTNDITGRFRSAEDCEHFVNCDLPGVWKVESSNDLDRAGAVTVWTLSKTSEGGEWLTDRRLFHKDMNGNVTFWIMRVVA